LTLERETRCSIKESINADEFLALSYHCGLTFHHLVVSSISFSIEIQSRRLNDGEAALRNGCVPYRRVVGWSKSLKQTAEKIF
jgi:hypothetical protein